MITFSKERRLGIVTVLAAALFALLPSLASAQFPPSVHIFFGELATITVDGQPIAADATIEAIDESGLVVATAIITNGQWSVQVDATVDAIRLRVGTDVSDLFPVISGEVTEVAALELGAAPLPTTRTVELDAGFNLVGWTGPDTPVEEVLTGISGEVLALHVWNGEAQEFDTYRVGLPGPLNTLTELETGDGVWIRMSGSGAWSLPDVVTDARAVELVRGFNLEVWSGPGGAPIAEAMATLTSGGRFEDHFTVFQFDPVTRTFRSYAPNRPTLLNDIETLAHGEAVWVVLVNASAEWMQPAP